MNVWYNFATVNELQKYLLQSLSVAIVDDHALILEGFKSLMHGCGVDNVETFIRAADLVSVLPHKKFDVYIIDIGMPDIDGFELIDLIREAHSDARIIVNTIHEEIWLLRRMLDKDVNAIMFKSTDFTQMVDAITAVVNGEQYMCPGLKKKLSNYHHRIEHPSEREIDILKALARGLTSKEIAQMLYISEKHCRNPPQTTLHKARRTQHCRPYGKGRGKRIHQRVRLQSVNIQPQHNTT